MYTKTGDKGQTSLVDGARVPKTHIRIESYGTVDELNSFTGLLLSHLDSTIFQTQIEQLSTIQHHLFNVGSHLATQDPTLISKLPNISSEIYTPLETAMDTMTNVLPELREFILPGGHPSAAHAHVCRTVCRRAERICLKLSESETINTDILVFLNRLSDYFFILSRFINFSHKITEPKWVKS